MRRARLICLIGLTCSIWLGVGSAVAAAAASSGQPPRASLTGFVCQRAANPFNRAIEVWGVMRPMSATQTMQMKFVLLRRSGPGAPFSAVQGGDLGRWRQAKPGTALYRVKRLVANLPAPAVYRFAVTFRWTGADGAVLGHTSLLSPRCYEP
jgi:hypothetical protein